MNNYLNEIPKIFWSVPAPELLRQLNTSPRGLTNGDALQGLTQFGENRLKRLLNW